MSLNHGLHSEKLSCRPAKLRALGKMQADLCGNPSSDIIQGVAQRSTKSRMSGSSTSACASAALMRQPPESPGTLSGD